MSKLRIHFAGVRPDERPIDLVCALGVGGFPPQHGPPGPEYGKYDELNRQAAEYFAPASMDEAQVVLYANRAVDSPLLQETARQAQQRGLPCHFFNWGDADDPIAVPHGTMYRHSMFSDTRKACEQAWPAFCSDPLAETGREFSPRPKQDLPTVGFCGYVGTPWQRSAYLLLGRREKGRGLSLRARALKALEACDRIKTQFITRGNYWAGTFADAHFGTPKQLEVRREFLDNLLGSDFTLCARGAGNFSYRLYETLAAGRIPLFVNTLCVLPFEREIDWRKHCVWVEEENLARAGEVLADFHAGQSASQLAAIAASNRQLWREWLCPLAFYRRILQPAADIANPPAAAVVR